MTPKERLSASVDADLLAQARDAVRVGRTGSLSSWINEAIRRQLEHDRRLAALENFVASYEAKHGRITDDEMREASRRARSRAVVVRGRRKSS
jgi:Arc/MetJ-type ribon-helix-helix transcriptional regulator